MTVRNQDNFIELSGMVTLTNTSMLFMWLKYADDEKGSNMSDNPSGKEWVGIAYNKTTMKESNNPKDYTWSKIKGDKGETGLQGLQGESGKDGIPGDKGESGQTTYFHIKYSHLENPQLEEDMQERPAEYIGTYVDFVQEDSKDPFAYTWYRFQGLQGERGEEGIPGGVGPSGKPAYLHIKYSDDGGKTFTYPNGETPGDWIGQYTDDQKKDSMDVDMYTWSKIKGDDGRSFTVKGQLGSTEELFELTGNEGEAYIVQGNLWGWIIGPDGRGAWVDLGNIKGEDGKDGITLYTWIKYADDDKGTGMSDNPSGKKYIGFAYNKTTQVESDNYKLYTWSKIQASDFTIGGTLESTDDLPSTGEAGYSYIIKGELWSWKVDPLTGVGSWANMGQFVGGSTIIADRELETYTWGVVESLINEEKTWYNVKNWNKIVKGDILIVPITIVDKDNCICHVYCDVLEQPENSNIKTLVKSTQVGPQGPPGPQGLQGLQGADGKDGIQGNPGDTTYFHIKYSHMPEPQTSKDMQEEPAEYIGTYVDTTKKDSEDPKRYTWYRFQGLQGPKGENGLPGGTGPNGKPAYLHIKYSNDGGSTFTGNNGEDVGRYIGVYTDENVVDSSFPGDYTWSLIKGNSVIMADTIERTATSVEIEGWIGKTDQWYSINNWMSMDTNDIIIIPIKVSDKKYAVCHLYCEVTQRPRSSTIYARAYDWQMGPEGPQGDKGDPGPILDWVQDWDRDKNVMIGGNKICSPRIFAGQLDSVWDDRSSKYMKKPTGVALGKEVFGTLDGFRDVNGICAYDRGVQTFSITTDGSVFFGDPSGRNGLIKYNKGNLSITAPSITLGVRDLDSYIQEQGSKAVSTTVSLTNEGLAVKEGKITVENGGDKVFYTDEYGSLVMKGWFMAGDNHGKIEMRNTNLYGYSPHDYTNPVYGSGVWYPDGDEDQPLSGYVSTSITNALLSDDEGALYMSGIKGTDWDGNVRARLRYTRKQSTLYSEIEFTKYGNLALVSSSNDYYREGFYLSHDGYVLPYKGVEYFGGSHGKWDYGYFKNLVLDNPLVASVDTEPTVFVSSNNIEKGTNSIDPQEFVDYIKNVKIGVFEEEEILRANTNDFTFTNNSSCRPYVLEKGKNVDKIKSLVNKRALDKDGSPNSNCIDVMSYVSALTIALQSTIQENEEFKKDILKIKNKLNM